MSQEPVPKIRLLLVDDHALFREGLARLLASEPDFEVAVPCATGDEALRVLDSAKIDLILLDYDLTGKPGRGFWCGRCSAAFRDAFCWLRRG